MATELNELSMTEVLGEPTDVSGIGQPGTSLSEMAFNLYKEATILVTFVSSLSSSR